MELLSREEAASLEILGFFSQRIPKLGFRLVTISTSMRGWEGSDLGILPAKFLGCSWLP